MEKRKRQAEKMGFAENGGESQPEITREFVQAQIKSGKLTKEEMLALRQRYMDSIEYQ